MFEAGHSYKDRRLDNTSWHRSFVGCGRQWGLDNLLQPELLLISRMPGLHKITKKSWITLRLHKTRGIQSTTEIYRFQAKYLNLLLRSIKILFGVQPAPDYAVEAFDSNKRHLSGLAPSIVPHLHPQAHFLIHPLQSVVHCITAQTNGTSLMHILLGSSDLSKVRIMFIKDFGAHVQGVTSHRLVRQSLSQEHMKEIQITCNAKKIQN
jgi:hypothetical protein